MSIKLTIATRPKTRMTLIFNEEKGERVAGQQDYYQIIADTHFEKISKEEAQNIFQDMPPGDKLSLFQTPALATPGFETGRLRLEPPAQPQMGRRAGIHCRNSFFYSSASISLSNLYADFSSACRNFSRISIMILSRALHADSEVWAAFFLPPLAAEVLPSDLVFPSC